MQKFYLGVEQRIRFAELPLLNLKFAGTNREKYLNLLMLINDNIFYLLS